MQEVRGPGLLLGVALDPDAIEAPEGKTPALAVVSHCLGHGLLLVPAGPDTVRLLPPLNVSDEDVDQALAILREAIVSLSA